MSSDVNLPPLKIASLPGVKRDGTRFEGDYHVDALWARWQRGLPRKIGGFRSINRYMQGIVRTMHGYTRDTLTYVHAASANLIERFTVTGAGVCSVITDRTPSTLTDSDLNMWQFDNVADSSNGTNLLVAQVAPNLECICNSYGGQFFTGDLLGTSALVEVTGMALPSNFSATGGVVVLHPYTFVFGNDGYVAWSVPGDPTDFTGSGAGNAYVAGQKIVRGLPLRGGPGNSPSGLLWSADELIRVSYIGGTPVFQFDTIAGQMSILGPQTVIEYDGIFYWIGTDRFLLFNGVVREIPNNLNLNWFFDNLNASQRQKVFAYKVPRYGEIWWCFPYGTATECTHAVIYNVRENTWYDTELPNGGRAGGLSPSIFRKPMLSGVEPQDFIATDAVIDNAGSGYAVGDVLEVVGGLGSIPVELTVSGVTLGAIDTVSISNAGRYEVVPDNPASVTAKTGTGVDATFTLTFVAPYNLWIHESGLNQIDGQNEQPVRSYYETADLMLPLLDASLPDRWLNISALEADFVQSGDLTVTITGRANARAPEVESDAMVIPEVATTSSEQIVHFKTQRRQLRFRFESNTINGDYQAGQILAHFQAGDGTITS